METGDRHRAVELKPFKLRVGVCSGEHGAGLSRLHEGHDGHRDVHLDLTGGGRRFPAASEVETVRVWFPAGSRTSRLATPSSLGAAETAPASSSPTRRDQRHIRIVRQAHLQAVGELVERVHLGRLPRSAPCGCPPRARQPLSQGRGCRPGEPVAARSLGCANPTGPSRLR